MPWRCNGRLPGVAYRNPGVRSAHDSRMYSDGSRLPLSPAGCSLSAVTPVPTERNGYHRTSSCRRLCGVM